MRLLTRRRSAPVPTVHARKLERAMRERLGRKDSDIAALSREHADAFQEYGGAVLRADLAALENVDWWQFRNG